MSVISFVFALIVGAAPGVEPVNAVIGDTSAQALRPGASLTEAERITTHLAYVEALLRARSTAHLDPERRARRSDALDRLRVYRERGVFPINTHTTTRAPVFVDADDRRCAVAALAEPELGAAAIEAIAAAHRLAYIGQIDDPDLLRWADTHGFTVTELAMIQPTYRPPLLVELEAAGAGRAMERVEARLASDWRICAGSAYSGNALFEVPEVDTTVTFYTVRRWLKGRVHITPRTPIDAERRQRFDGFVSCVVSSFANRRFRSMVEIVAGRTYPLKTRFVGGPRLMPDGRLARGPASAVLEYIALTQGNCVGSEQSGGRWRIRATIGRGGSATRISVRRRGKKGSRAVRRCLEETLKSQLNFAFPEIRKATRLKVDVELGADPKRIEQREQWGMSDESQTVSQAQILLSHDWLGCAGEQYPEDVGYAEHGVKGSIVFEPDGRRFRARLTLEPAASTPAMDRFVECVTRRFDRRRFHLDDGWPGDVYPVHLGAFYSKLIDADGGLGTQPLENRLYTLSHAVRAVCPVEARIELRWRIAIDAAPGGQLTRLEATGVNHIPDPAVLACVADAFRARLRLPPITRASSLELKVAFGKPASDETLQPTP